MSNINELIIRLNKIQEDAKQNSNSLTELDNECKKLGYSECQDRINFLSDKTNTLIEELRMLKLIIDIHEN
jgi:predicted Zn-ribbon and HTH transcriptional regulator